MCGQAQAEAEAQDAAPGKKGSRVFHSPHPFAERLPCTGREHLLAGRKVPLIDRNTSTVAGGGWVVAQSSMGCCNPKKRAGASMPSTEPSFPKTMIVSLIKLRKD